MESHPWRSRHETNWVCAGLESYLKLLMRLEIILVICTPSQHSLVLDMAGAVGWRENHNIVTLCATPHFKDDELTKRSLVICVFAKSNVKHNFTIPHPSSDTWCDSLQEDEWTMDEGQSLRGKHFS